MCPTASHLCSSSLSGKDFCNTKIQQDLGSILILSNSSKWLCLWHLPSLQCQNTLKCLQAPLYVPFQLITEDRWVSSELVVMGKIDLLVIKGIHTFNSSTWKWLKIGYRVISITCLSNSASQDAKNITVNLTVMGSVPVRSKQPL